MPDMTLMTALAYLITGAVLGPIFGSALKGGGFGLFGNLCMGILGACAGGWVATVGNIVTDNDLQPADGHCQTELGLLQHRFPTPHIQPCDGCLQTFGITHPYRPCERSH